MTDLAGHVRASLWWLIPLVVLVLVVGWETGWGKALTRHPAPAEPIAPKPVVASLLPEYSIPGGPAGHPEMVQRTLFNPTRRPAPAAPEATASRLQRGQFALTGTLMIDGKSTAFLREVQGNKARRVLAGDKINGMVVAEVRPDRVKLTLGDESEELVLKVGTNPRPTSAARRARDGCRCAAADRSGRRPTPAPAHRRDACSHRARPNAGRTPSGGESRCHAAAGSRRRPGRRHRRRPGRGAPSSSHNLRWSPGRWGPRRGARWHLW